MATNNAVEMSKEFYELFARLSVKNVVGKSLCFRKTDEGHVCSRFDEETSNVFFYLMFDEYSFNFPGDHITFSNFTVFLDACKRQGFLKDPSFKIARVVDKKSHDVVQMFNKKSSMSCKLYNPNAFPDEVGFLEEFDLENLDPEMFSFKLSAKQIDEINEVCNSRHFECDYFCFNVKADCIVLCFTGPNDVDYKIRIEKDDIVGFDKIDIGEELKFNYYCFTIMNQIEFDYTVSVLCQDDNYNVMCRGERIVGNQNIKSIVTSPSKVSND